MRQALRTLLRTPGFTLVAVLTLALGIGATTTIFGVVNAVVLRPLPYDETDRLVLIWNNFLKLGMERLSARLSEYVDYANQNRVFEQIAGFNNANFNLTSGNEPERIVGARVTASLFPLLGARPFAGRVFQPEENQPGRDRPAVLSYGLWQRRFGSDPATVGSSIVLDGRSYTIIGIMPPDFQFPHPSFPFAERADLWVPIVFDSSQMTQRGDPYGVRVIARLKPDVTIDRARADMDGIGQQYPGYRGPGGADLGWKITVVSLMDEVIGGSRRALFVLLGAVGFVLLIACVYVANLLLVRTSSRQKELAVRTALGATRARLMQQSLIESLMLGILGGTGGLLLSLWGIEAVATLAPGNIPRIREASFDPQVFGFAFGVSVLSCLFFGVFPALKASAIPASDWLRHGNSITGGPIRSRIGNVFVVSEIALALVLLSGAGLLIQSFLRLRDVSPGFDADHVLTVELSIPRSKYAEPPEVARFYRGLRSALATLPGVRSASIAETTPFRGGTEDPFSIEGRPFDPSAIPVSSRKATGPSYFLTLGVPLRRGREFTERDGATSERVAVLNETMAKAYWPNEDPIGQRIKLGAPGSPFPWVRIVGIAGDVPRGLDRTPRPEWYLPHEQQPVLSMVLLIRTSGDPVAVLPRVRDELRTLDREQPITRVGTLDDTIQQAIAQPRFRSLALTLFAALALALAGVGIFGVVSYSVSQRTQEIGVRMALGARRTDVLRLVLRQVLTLLSTGVVVGIAGSLVLNPALSSLLFAVTPTDSVTYAVVSLVVVLVGLAASCLPAYRAARVDPLLALRHE